MFPSLQFAFSQSEMLLLAIIVVLIWMIISAIQREKRIREEINGYRIRFVDRSGIKQIPPTMDETLAGKTYNIKVDEKHVVSIAQFTWTENTVFISRIAMLYNGLVKMLDEIEQLNISPGQRLQKNMIIMATIREIGKLVYHIARRVDRSKDFKHAFLKRFESDTNWSFEIIANMLDYWKDVKKKASLCAEGKTLRQTLGESCMQSLLNEDGTLNDLTKPHFEKFLKSSRN